MCTCLGNARETKTHLSCIWSVVGPTCHSCEFRFLSSPLFINFEQLFFHTLNECWILKRMIFFFFFQLLSVERKRIHEILIFITHCMLPHFAELSRTLQLRIFTCTWINDLMISIWQYNESSLNRTHDKSSYCLIDQSQIHSLHFLIILHISYWLPVYQYHVKENTRWSNAIILTWFYA